MAVDKPPQALKEKLWFYVDDKDKDWPDLIMFEKWLSTIAFVQARFSAFKGERREEDRRGTNRDKRFSKTSNFSASSNVQVRKFNIAGTHGTKGLKTEKFPLKIMGLHS